MSPILRIGTVAVALFLLAGCASWGPRRVNPELRLFLAAGKADFQGKTVLVFPFREPSYAAGKGQLAGRFCHELLIAGRNFRVVGQYLESPWDRLGESEEARLLAAVSEGAAKGFDVVLLGELTEYRFGQLTPSRVGVRLRLIEVATRVTRFFGENARQHAGKDPTYPLDTRLMEPAMPADQLARRVLAELLGTIR
jgi:hypothetical protein